MPMTKEEAKNLRGEYRPKGKVVEVAIDALRFRRTTSTEVLRCCNSSRHFDIQSGWYTSYCGDIAEYVADTTEGRGALCEKHRPPQETLEEPQFNF